MADLSALPEVDLVARALDGDREAFGILVERHYRTVFAVAMARVRDAEQAQDLTQEVFLRGFLALGQLRSGERLAPWLARMTRNLAIDWARREASVRRLVPQIPLEELQQEPPDQARPNPAQRLERTEAATIVLEHVGRLPPHLREVVFLSYFEGLTQKQIAEIQGISQAAVAGRLRISLRHLRGALEPLLKHGLSSLALRPPSTSVVVAWLAVLTQLAPEARAALTREAVALGTGPPSGADPSLWAREFLLSHRGVLVGASLLGIATLGLVVAAMSEKPARFTALRVFRIPC